MDLGDVSFGRTQNIDRVKGDQALQCTTGLNIWRCALLVWVVNTGKCIRIGTRCSLIHCGAWQHSAPPNGAEAFGADRRTNT